MRNLIHELDPKNDLDRIKSFRRSEGFEEPSWNRFKETMKYRGLAFVAVGKSVVRGATVGAFSLGSIAAAEAYAHDSNMVEAFQIGSLVGAACGASLDYTQFLCRYMWHESEEDAKYIGKGLLKMGKKIIKGTSFQ